MDYYTQNPSRLQGQPKKTIGDYVAQNGILVPRRFESLKEARKSKKGIMARSEHEQEYDGVSGLIDSLDLSSSYYNMPGVQSINQIKRNFFEKEDNKNGTPIYQQYCLMKDIDFQAFKEQVTYSLWERIPGINRTVVADSAIAGRYHIMSQSKGLSNTILNYSIVDNGRLKQFIRDLPEEVKQSLPILIDTYETIRNLERFDPNHCPIMEFQTKGDKNYFLQYHRARDFSPSTFTLDREPTKNEIQSSFTRGATGPEGRKAKITLLYNADSYTDFDPKDEDGSYDLHYAKVFSEVHVRERAFQLIHSDTTYYELQKVIVNHLTRSKLFKSEVSLMHNLYDMISDEEFKVLRRSKKEGVNTTINLHIVSDGRKAYLSRI